eukprot:TRINITY_DN2976_c0_g1_i1.p1 TRINITY_DN2976_c0_g1~~TRINITY_DN2976_c0_g1_i1.p1  ORF type:complete len:834 (+),score=200.73 TRINITY_DN2976_c0_g1_i1:96-2597(+)
MEAPFSMDEGTKRFLNGLRTPVWIINLTSGESVFANERGLKLSPQICSRECLNNQTNEILKTVHEMIKETIAKGGNEFKSTFNTEEGPMKANFHVLPQASESTSLVMLEAHNLKRSKDFVFIQTPRPSEFQTTLWNEAKSRSPQAEAMMVLYNLQTGKVILSNKWAKQKLPKDIFENDYTINLGNRTNPTNFLPYIKDRLIVEKILRKLNQNERVQLIAEVDAPSQAEHLFLIEKTRDPTTGEDLIVCFEEDITHFVEPKRAAILRSLTKPQPEFTAMLGMSEMLVSTYLSKDYASPDLLRDSSETLLRIINMFDLCKIEEGSMVLESAEFDIYSTVEDCVEFASSVAKHKGLHIDLFTSGNIPTKLLGDSRRLKHVLLNFISNAIKFSKPGSGQVLVTLEPAQVETGPKYITLKLDVIDQGIGVAAKDMNLFLDWSHIANSYKTNKETGIGLAVSKQIVELMGGNISVKSILGEGTTISCQFTLEVVAQIGSPLYTYRTAPSNLHGMRVLIVGDSDKKEIEILQQYLKEWGLYSETVDSAANCIEILTRTKGTENAFELVFISPAINDMKAFKLHKMIDKTDDFGQLQAVVITNKRKLGDRLSTQPSPIRRSRLFELLHKFAGRRQFYKKTDTLTNRIGNSNSSLENKGEINVLVVEDNAMAQVFASRILRKTGGYKVDSVTNGKQAIEAFKKGNFDIILMDCQMPELDGYLATKQIRDLEKETGGHVIIIAVTAMNMQEDRDRCFQMGMDDFLSKPVKNVDLVQKITHWSKTTKINKEEVEFGEFNTVQPSASNPKRRHSTANQLPSAVSLFQKRYDTSFPLGSKKDRLLI